MRVTPGFTDNRTQLSVTLGSGVCVRIPDTQGLDTGLRG